MSNALLERTVGDPAARMRYALEEAGRLGLSPVAIYGAGQHTAKVLTALHEAPVQIAAFLDDSPDRHPRGICGWPVIHPSDVAGTSAQAIIINTDRYEQSIWESRSVFEAEGLRVFRLYPEFDDTSIEPEPQTLHEVEAAMNGRQALSREAQHLYWSTRFTEEADETNPLTDFAHWISPSLFLADWLADTDLAPQSRILEVGSNVGRHLAFLRSRGYEDLNGVEINSFAVSKMHDLYPETADKVEVTIGSLEQVLPTLPDKAFDLVFSVVVLTHIHPDSDFVLDHIARISRRYISTIEAEAGTGARVFERDYHKVFTSRGYREVKSLAFRDAGVEQIQLFHLEQQYTARLFERQT